MEKDNELKGDGNSYTTEFRQYDPRLGRWLSLDPLMAQFPWMSPYVAFNNNPVCYNDPLGLKGEPATVCDNGKEVEGFKPNNNLSYSQSNNSPTVYQEKYYSIESEISSPDCDYDYWENRKTSANNLMIIIRRKDNIDYSDHVKYPYEDGDFLVVFSESLNSAYTFVKDVSEKDKTYETTLLNIHGSTVPETNVYGEEVWPSKNNSLHFSQDLQISFWDIDNYLMNSNELPQDDRTEITGIVDFMTITSKYFVFYTCVAAGSIDLVTSMQKLMINSNMNLTMYMNGDITSTYVNEGKIVINGPLTTRSTINHKRSNGWTRITKGGITNIKNEGGKSGNLKINRNGGSATSEENKR